MKWKRLAVQLFAIWTEKQTVKKQAATCSNFKNICKSVSERQCFRTVIDLLENPFRDKVTFKPGPRIHKDNTLSKFYLDEKYQFVSKFDAIYYYAFIIINGIEFRNNTVVAVKNHDHLFFPTYGIIREIMELDNQIHFRVCETVFYDEFVQAYEVQVSEVDHFMSIEAIFQHTTFSFWKKYAFTTKTTENILDSL